MKLLKAYWYGMFVSYHMRKTDKISLKYKTIHHYHWEMAQHYYEKAFGVPFKSKLAKKT